MINETTIILRRSEDLGDNEFLFLVEENPGKIVVAHQDDRSHYTITPDKWKEYKKWLKSSKIKPKNIKLGGLSRIEFKNSSDAMAFKLRFLE